jgi:hypothetical protein
MSEYKEDLGHFFLWSGCDLLSFGFLYIGSKNTNLDMALPWTGNTELILPEQKLWWLLLGSKLVVKPSRPGHMLDMWASRADWDHQMSTCP